MSLTPRHIPALAREAECDLVVPRNIARLAGEQGAMIGFLLLNRVDMSTQIQQISHFHMLLPEYDVIIFSEYRSCAVSGINDMVAAARRLGKKVLIDHDGIDLSASIGASLITSDIETLQSMIGAWRNEDELNEQDEEAAFHLQLRWIFGQSQCRRHHALCPGTRRPLFECDAMRQIFPGCHSRVDHEDRMSILAAVSKASDHFDPAVIREESVMSSHNEMYS